jgi:site-specific recombinase XerD
VSTFFDFRWRKKWIPENPCLRIKRVHIDYGVPEILPLAQCESLLRTAELRDRELIPRLVLMLFAGVRRDEVSRLSRDAIDFDRALITIDAAASKVRIRRITQLNSTALPWLRRGGQLPCGLNLRRHIRRLRLTAGITKWPHDVLRHTAASHLVVLDGTAQTAHMLGHSAGILHRHYRQLVRPEDNQEAVRLPSGIHLLAQPRSFSYGVLWVSRHEALALPRLR